MKAGARSAESILQLLDGEEVSYTYDTADVMYVGDNIAKDFQAPQQLGMKYLHFNNNDGLYWNNESSVLPCCEKIVEVMNVFE